jgi:uncharacterized protein YbcI
MAFDFNPDLTPEEAKKPKKEAKEVVSIGQSEASLVSTVTSNSDVVTMNNLLAITQSHIQDDNECREVIENLTSELNNSIHLMSIKEILEYLKVKLREREFHVDCIFKAYAFIQRSEYAREMFVGSHRKERIIEASDRKRISGLLSMLNDTGE